MTFGEKLFKLRKDKGFSQEALAEQLNTTRQAISKWENNQGYPETDKLLMLSNIFEVSVDSLLKENAEQTISTEKGFYVSRESAEGFLSFHRKTTMRAAMRVAIMILAGIPYYLFANNQTLSITFACVVLIIAAISLIFIACILETLNFFRFPVLEIQRLFTACSVYLFIYVVGIADTYDILVQSKERMDSIYWRIVKKLKNKF